MKRAGMLMSKWQWFILLLLIVFLYLLNSAWFWKSMYPVAYEQEIREAAHTYQVDPYLVMAIVQVESHSTAERLSHKGAIGLMQIMPDTAEWIMAEGGFSPLVMDQLDEPRINLAMGSWYLKYLVKRFGGNLAAVTAAYNAGPNKVSEWKVSGVWDGSPETLDRIPYGETRHYVQRVLYYYQRYQSIY